MSDARGERRLQLREARKVLYTLPVNAFFELSGRPSLLYELKAYGQFQPEGARIARAELPFLFRAFETGQAPPPKNRLPNDPVPRAATIHEYLDWTVTAAAANTDEELDFDGFRVVMLLPRYKPQWPPPGAYEGEGKKCCMVLGAPRNPLPELMPDNKPVCAATIRSGLGYLEVPFFATAEARRGKGFGRALLEAIEEIARGLSLPRLLLCSTDDPVTKGVWTSLGFHFTSKEELELFGIKHGDLMHMDNTVQMHKLVPAPLPWRSVVIRHQHLVQRLYYLDPSSGVKPPGAAGGGKAAKRPKKRAQDRR